MKSANNFYILLVWCFVSGVFQEFTTAKAIPEEPGHLNITDIDKKDGHITFGEIAHEGQFPYQVFLHQNGGHICGGSIISDRWVLTAAHCVENAVQMTLYFGSIYENQGISQSAIRYIKHEEYVYIENVILINDIALLELQTKLEFNEHIQPIKLPKRSDAFENLSGKQVRASGLGYVLDQPIVESEVLRFADLIVTDDNGNTITTVGKNKVQNTCRGDSGGPVAYEQSKNNWVLVGVVSSGFEMCRYKSSLQTKVAHYLDWIEKHTGIKIEN